MASKRKDTDLAGLAARAERAKAEGDPTGFISGGIYSDFSIILGGYIVFNDEIPETEQKRIILKATLPPYLTRPITENSLLESCSLLEKEYLAQPKNAYRILTEVSLQWTINVPRIRIGDVSLTFKPKLNKAYRERARLANDVKWDLNFELPHSYMRVSAFVYARSTYEAAQKSLDAVDLVRASWNLALNRGKTWRYSSGRTPPINDIHLSPFHTVHKADGSLATNEFWYEPRYSKPAQIFTDKTKFERVLAFARNLRIGLSKLKYREDIESALIRYVRALDTTDLNDTFLSLWSLLEYLTDSSNTTYKVTTRRAAFLFADRESSNLVLSNLTNHRNRFVHVGSESENIESLVFQLKRYVNALLLFHLGNRFGFASRAEAAQFMDLPTSKSELDLKILRLQQARRYISGGS